MAKPGSLLFVLSELNKFTEKHVKILTLDVTANLIEDTPRDTGWARSNWIPSIGRSFDNTVGSPEAVSAAAQQAGLASVVTSYVMRSGVVYVSNNVDYILPLNDGSSKQAPAGFVQFAVLRAVRESATKRISQE